VVRPQNGKAESLEPLIELASTGRKRGFCFIAAGTRVSMMAKSITELLENKLIGRSGMNDAERAAKELEFDKHGRKELRSLPTGHFYAYGPAIALDPVLVQTPKELPVLPRRRGEHRAPTPATSAKVKRALEKFAGLEEEAEQTERSMEQLQAQLATAQAKVRQLEKGAPAPVVDRAAIAREIAASVEKALLVERREMKRRIGLAVKDVRGIAQAIGTRHGELVGLGAALESMVDSAGASRAEVQVGHTSRDAAATTGANHSPASAVGQSSRAPARPIATPAAAGDGSVSPGEQRILDAIAELLAIGVQQPSRSQVGIMASYDLTGGSGSRHVSALRDRGLIEIPAAGSLVLSASGMRAARHPERPLSRAKLHAKVLSRLNAGEQRILTYLLEIHPATASRADVGREVRYDLTGGSGSRHVSKLVTLNLVDIPGAGQLKAGALLFPPGLS
jgi:hypothetical protein